jgi:hypothetical protein
VRQPEDAASGAHVGAQPLGPWWLRVPAVAVGTYLVALVAMVAIVLSGVVPGLTLRSDIPDSLPVQAMASVAAIGFLAVAWRLVENRPVAELGYVGPPRRSARELAVGCVFGGGAVTLVVGVGHAAGALHLTPRAGAASLSAHLTWLATLLVAAHFEEVLMRGYVLQVAARWSAPGAVVLTSVAFAALHATNPGREGLVSTAVTMGVIALSGAWLATLFLRSRGLWLPTGAHLGWNWATGVLFGLPVSGVRLPIEGLVDMTSSSSHRLVAGGAFGPESSLVALVVVGVLAAEGAWRCFGRPLNKLPCP